VNARPRLALLVAAGVAAGGASAPAGELAWQSRVIAQDAAPGDRQAVAEFVFTNTSAQTVRVRQVATSCGCTTAKLEKREIAPGESGVVRVVFTFGGREGLQEKAVVLKLADHPPEVLGFRVCIPPRR
jgi:hypothetical protein